MSYFLIQISFYAPYPRKEEYKLQASGFGTAISRAIRELRKEYKGKRIKQYHIDITRL